MTKAVFVGDAPSKTNTSKNIAFVGAKCFPRLVEWINVIDPDFYVCINSSVSELETISKLYAAGFKVLALGSTASERLEAMSIPHYAIPHPSGRNLKMNSAADVNTWLDLAKSYVDAGELERTA